MKSFRSTVLLALCMVMLIALLGACADGGSRGSGNAAGSRTAEEPVKDQPQDETKTVVDNAGHHVTVPVHPQRIVAPYLEDPLVVLGIKPVAQVLYGNVEQNYLHDQLPDAAIIDTTGGGLPLEKVLDLSPDLIVIGAGMAGEGAYEQYAKIAPTYVVDNVNKSWRATLLDLAELLGRKPPAEDQLAAYDQEIGKVKEQLSQIVGHKTAAIIVLSEKEFYTMGHIQGGKMLFDELGVQPHRLTPVKDEWNTLSLEKLNELDADYLFVIKTERYQPSELEGNPLWKGLPAVRENRVFGVESGIWQYSGLICNERTLADIQQAIVEQKSS